MTINYWPYEPPPPTQPPPQVPLGFVAAPGPAQAQPATRQSLVGQLLCVLGLGMALVGLFAFPLQRYGPEDNDLPRNIGFIHIRELVTGEKTGWPDPNFASSLAMFWWDHGLLLAVAALTVLTGATCVSVNAAFLRVFGMAAALIGAITGVLFGLAMAQTTDYRSVIYLQQSNLSMFHDSGSGPWLAFAGLGALTIGGLVTVIVNRRAG